MIKFRCSSCQKAIGVNEKYGGRLIKCPSCKNATRVPAADGSSQAPQAAVAPTASAAMAATSAHVPKVNANPICPSCNSELFNPSDTMCGICGHLLDQIPMANAPITPRPVQATPVMATPVSATPLVPGGVPATPVGLPVNPAISSPYAKPANSYDPSIGSAPKTSDPTTGRSVGAWFAAVAVGMFLALIWGIIASFTGTGGQVFAWAIGAIVGCIAGLIARNPSVPFCLATTAGALLAMLFGRLVSAVVIMVWVSGMSSLQGAFDMFVPDTGVSIGVMEDLIAKGEIAGDEKDYAEMKIDAFYSNQNIYQMPAYDEIESEIELEIDRKVREAMKEMSDEDKKAMLEKVRADHPEWIEEAWQYSAILDSMVEGDEIEDAELLDHARSELSEIDGNYDLEYENESSPKQLEERETKLRKMVMDKYASMDDQQRKDAIKNARLNHLKWTPVEHEYLAMLDAMYSTDDILEELKEIAKSEINLRLKMNYDDAFDPDEEVDYEEREKLKSELEAFVNAEVLKLEQDEIDKMVAAATDKYPHWTPVFKFDGLGELSSDLDDQIARFDSDGTFWSSLKTRFRMLDFVWLTLGMISAFAIAFTLGQSGKKS